MCDTRFSLFFLNWSFKFNNITFVQAWLEQKFRVPRVVFMILRSGVFDGLKHKWKKPPSCH